MCNLFNQTTNQQAMIDIAKSFDDFLGNLEPSIDIWPDYQAAVIRNGLNGRREGVKMRWGLPSSSQAIFQNATKRADKLRTKGKEVDFPALLKMEPDSGTTNVRNTNSRHWTRWLSVPNRCIVPVTSFAEPDPANKGTGPTPNAWFALNDDRPLMFFAGIWVPQWESVRKVREGLTTNDLFGFLTTEPNDVVGAVHQKAMPVLLTTADEVEAWLTRPWDEARVVQRPLPNGTLKIVPAPEKVAA